MKQIIIIFLVTFSFYQWLVGQESILATGDSSHPNEKVLSDAIKNRYSDVQVNGSGVVIKLLKDDTKGSRHQKFILRLESGKTILVAHNIDLSPRIDSISKGDKVEFYGEYEWNSRGGVVHWTHKDPMRKHISGWLKHNRKVYE